MTALGVHGTCRLVAFELLTYWEPGGTVFPSVTTLADGLGVQPRIVRGHLARLERIGLWVRVARPGRANLYKLRLPVFVSDETEPRIVEGEPRIVGSAPPGSHDPPEVTKEVTKKVQAAAVPAVLSLPPPDQQQQRIEGMLASCEISCRETGRPAFETEWHRDRLRSGELTIERLQAFTNELRAEREAEKWRVRL